MPERISKGKMEKAISLYLTGDTIKGAADKAGVSYFSLWSELHTKGLKGPRRTPSHTKPRIYNLNEHFFQTINTEEKAYWLGFITADGGLSSGRTKYTLGIALAAVDTGHLYKFQRALETDTPIRPYQMESYGKTRDYARVHICSKQMFQDLGALGVTARKSWIVKPCLQVPQELRTAYWRGLFDGDGSVYKSARKWVCSFCGNNAIVTGFEAFIHKHYPDTGTRYMQGELHYVSFSGAHLASKVLDLLYNGASIYLDRKYEKYQKCAEEVLEKCEASASWANKAVDVAARKQERADQTPTKADLLEAHQHLKDWTSVAWHFGVHVETIRAYRKLYGLEVDSNHLSPRPNRAIEVSKEELEQSYQELGNWGKVAARFGISMPTLYRLKHRHGLENCKEVDVTPKRALLSKQYTAESLQALCDKLGGWQFVQKDLGISKLTLRKLRTDLEMAFPAPGGARMRCT